MKIPQNLTLAHGLVAVIVFSYLFLARQPVLRFAVPGLLGAAAVCIASLAFLLYEEGKGKLTLSPRTILCFALLFRLLFLFRPPELSDDIYRYLWDGLQVWQGNNPYRAAPWEVTPPDDLAAALLAKINHPRLVTIYPPLAQLVFAAGAFFRSLTGIKILLVILDMAACLLIFKILSRLHLSPGRAIMYAWHPLPIIEIAGSGHVDGVGILLLFLTIYVLFSLPDSPAPRAPELVPYARPLLAGLIFAMAVCVKFIPLIYLPALLAAVVSPLALSLGILAGLLAIGLPFMPDLTEMLTTLVIYLHDWEFANFAFRRLRDLLSSGNQARLVLSVLFMACILFFAISLRRRSRRCVETRKFLLLIQSLYGITFGFLLLSPTLHPWYALYLVCLLPFMAGPAGLVLSWAVFLSYHVLIDYASFGQWRENDMIAGMVWLAPVMTWLTQAALRFFPYRRASGRPLEK